MNTISWILIAVAVIVVLAIVLIVVGKKRGDSKKVSFEKPAEEAPKELTQEQKSGNYQAKSGFNFAPAGSGADKQPEKVPAAQPAAQPEAKPAEAPAEPSDTRDATELANAQLADEDVEAPVAEPTTEPAAESVEPEAVGPKAEETPEVDSTDTAAGIAAGAGVAGAAAATAASAAADEEAPVEEAPAEAETESVEEDTVSVEPVAEDEPVAQDVPDLPEAEEAAVAAEAQTAGAEAALDAEPEELQVSEDAEVIPAPSEPDADIEPAGGRLGRLRGRLSRSQNAIGQGLLGILSAGDLDEDAWEEIEDTLIMADLGTKSTLKVTESLRDKIAERGVSSEEEARAMLRESLIEAAHPEMDRSIKAMPNEGKPAVIMVVGVNGTGKTTTTGKLARVLVAMGHKVLLGAADTFRAAAADQLETWGRRVGATTVRGKEGADPASVAFDAVAAGVDQGVDVVLVDTAGRLHTSVDLMDQLGKVKRVVEKKTEVDEVLLVLDATVGQNGLTQARIFREVVDITGVVLTKLDGTAKGGIVFQVQEELGVPVKLVGLGEGADDLAPFEVEGFVDALLGEK
ncbi:TPA: signal recognition particle-docking protein FtsY [Corynebacterium striatum]|uniref:signal recognition particle-docking protein FtsY n=1 Tax=Corynebacterium striatum TaxID=43770 RepID=UPI00191FD0AC|nr:signal recognition particle-docking protein FtsY [Corynebacterium striatum]MCG7249242.1 signal recognition particle-docking protein FtsY [Corynebacterium striatum]QQU79413.1 signal recognition particle-docking protein FtsY [Corynebacterium striatum]HAT1180585.1 signal recognition particle-docking protein FtsY [Corynebacterium striatum]HBC8574450.1 signal recognition particle-docking protein FtsY [Corynebacterium striatum]